MEKEEKDYSEENKKRMLLALAILLGLKVSSYTDLSNEQLEIV
jgi:hypothetical protein